MTSSNLINVIKAYDGDFSIACAERLIEVSEGVLNLGTVRYVQTAYFAVQNYPWMIEYDEFLVDKYDFSGDEDNAARSTTRISFGPSPNGDSNKCTVVFDAPKMNVFELRSHWPLIAFSPMIMLLGLVAGPCIYHETRQRFKRCQALTGKYLGNVSGGGIHSDIARTLQNVTNMQQRLGVQGGQGPTAEQMQQMAQGGQGHVLTAEQLQQLQQIARGSQGMASAQTTGGPIG